MNPESRHERKQAPARWQTAIVVVLGLAGVMALVGAWFQWGAGLTLAGIEETIQSWGAWGVVGSILAMVVHSFIPFPAEIIAVANGMVYGLVWGTVITWTGAMIGALLAFGLARRFGRPFVDRMVARKEWDALDGWLADHGWKVVFVGRLIPVIAFNLINYAAGLTRITWRAFALATAVGILPVTVLVVMMGDNIESMEWGSWLALLAGALVLWIAVRRRLRRQLDRPAKDE